MTVTIGGNALNICGSSKLWHPHQNEMAQFSGRMNHTLHHSFIGNYEGDALDGRFGGAQYLFKTYPNIRSLNVVLNLVMTCSTDGGPLRKLRDDVQRDGRIGSFYRLVLKYGRQLASFKLWVRAELCPDDIDC